MTTALSGDKKPIVGGVAAVDNVAVPLCVDLDNTLVRTNIGSESFFAVVARRRLGGLLASGRAPFKDRLAELAALDPALLPYNEQLLAYLREQKARGRHLVLVTGAASRIAHSVAQHLALFDEVIASDDMRNLVGKTKADALVERFGLKGFAYAGNHRRDLPVWRAARSSILVNASSAIRATAEKVAPVEAEFSDRASLLRAAVRAIRPHQWVKNLLLFIPIVTAHAIGDVSAWMSGIGLFVVFCATASAIYLVNDLVDLSADRQHPRKRDRPLASGKLPLMLGVALALALFAVGFGLSAVWGTLPIVVVYATLSICYSLLFKEFPLVDVFLLAALYTIRVIGGGVATGYAVTLWLLAFSGFLFLSLALVKRVQELMMVARVSGDRAAARRGYHPADVTILQTFGCASAFASSVVLALFVASAAASSQYSSPELLWGTVPLILFWQCRLWLATARGYMHDDPIVYAIRDWVSWITAACVLALLLAAAYGLVSFA
jgi:4-hydroxybenzoate polyprenyltransferase/phosphoserine phosphatase